MKSNIVIKVVAVTIALILLVIILKSNKSTASNPSIELQKIESGPMIEDNGLSLDGFQNDYLEDELGVDVDTPLERNLLSFRMKIRN